MAEKAQGAISSKACLDRIEARRAKVHAWEASIPRRAQAGRYPRQARRPSAAARIPLAVKDIIATRPCRPLAPGSIATTWWQGRRCVTQLVKAAPSARQA